MTILNYQGIARQMFKYATLPAGAELLYSRDIDVFPPPLAQTTIDTLEKMSDLVSRRTLRTMLGLPPEEEPEELFEESMDFTDE